MPNINNIVKQLKSRRVFRSLAIYAAFAFVLLQVCDIVIPRLFLPEWTMTLIIVLVIIGLPTTLVLSWIYDVTPEGVEKTDKEKVSSNINYSTIMLILVIIGGLLFYFQDKFFKPQVNPKSIAVLPFENYSPKSEDEYLSAGFTEVIIANLAKVQDLMVISRTSVMRYKKTEMSLKDIAEELNVANILEGSIQRTDDEIRIVVQLIDAQTDQHLWSETYDNKMEDIFIIQTDIASKVADGMKSEITKEEKQQIEYKLTDNTKAYEYYLKIQELRDGHVHNFELILDLFKKIFEFDPEFAEAYALLSIEYSERVHFGKDKTQKNIDLARENIEKAFSLKPDSPEVRFAYGYYYYGCFKDYLRAFNHYQLALEKEPGNAKYNSYIGYVHRRLGNWDETIKYLKKARRLSPNDQSSGGLQESYIFLKNYKKVDYIKQYNRNHRLNPDQGSIYSTGANLTFLLEGKTDNARKIIENTSKLIPDFNYNTWVRNDNMAFKLIDFDYQDHNYEVLLKYYQENKDSIFISYYNIKTKSSIIGFIYYLMDQKDHSKSDYKKALNLMYQLEDFEYDSRYHKELGFIYAMLDEDEKALKEARTAITLTPSTKDAFIANFNEIGLAKIYCVLGEHEKALNIIEKLFNEPSHLNWMDKYDPLFKKSYNNNPRFNRIVKIDEDRFRREATYDLNIYLPW